ncbi:hypothetical protein EDD17DRAFT_860808 [Pisolithus thermaeus]|nr:hypothetical protein EDD17DRAFT_860808 [Pisolithus thermaeus]
MELGGCKGPLLIFILRAYLGVVSSQNSTIDMYMWYEVSFHPSSSFTFADGCRRHALCTTELYLTGSNHIVVPEAIPRWCSDPLQTRAVYILFVHAQQSRRKCYSKIPTLVCGAMQPHDKTDSENIATCSIQLPRVNCG